MAYHNPVLGGGGIHHVALKTKNWDASLAFYKDVLGFAEKITWAYPDGNHASSPAPAHVHFPVRSSPLR